MARGVRGNGTLAQACNSRGVYTKTKREKKKGIASWGPNSKVQSKDNSNRAGKFKESDGGTRIKNAGEPTVVRRKRQLTTAT